jgi:hypothetical protein
VKLSSLKDGFGSINVRLKVLRNVFQTTLKSRWMVGLFEPLKPSL